MYQYLSRLVDTIFNRQDISVELLRYTRPSSSQGQIAGRLRFLDGSLVFRFDTSPHHPHLSTHPHHKHSGEEVLPANPPGLSEVLREIDAILYPKPQ